MGGTKGRESRGELVGEVQDFIDAVWAEGVDTETAARNIVDHLIGRVRDVENLQRAYQSERDHVRRLTHHEGAQWGVRWPDGKIIACGDKGGALYGVKDYSGVMPGGVLIRRSVGSWEEAT